MRLLKGAVRRDLEWLLNTRRIFDFPDDGLKEVNRSAYMYGLPDLSALTMATSGDRNKLSRQMVAAINLFEPRLANVRVVLGRNRRRCQGRRCVCASRPCCAWTRSPEPISFDTVIELKSGNCRLSGGDDAR